MIDQYFEGSLPRENWEEFSNALSESAELRREFRKRGVLDEFLHTHALGKAPEIPYHYPQPNTYNHIPWIISAACMVACFFIWETKEKNQPLEKSAIADAVTATPSAPIAKLIDFYDLKFKDSTKSVENIHFDQGKYVIDRGQLHLRFDDSVDLLFSGPCSFEILNSKVVKMTQGKVRTIVLNEKGHEFTILSPTSKYIDWGTEFSLNISPRGKDLVNVHEGKIEVQSLTDNKTSNMLTRWSKSSDIPKPALVLINKKLENSLPGEMGAYRNQKSLDELAADPDVIGLYDFRHPRTGKDKLVSRTPKTWEEMMKKFELHRFVENLHLSNTGASHGVYHGANRTNGRWPRSTALNLFREDAHLSLDLEQNYENFSFTCWLKPSGKLNNPLNSLIRPYRWEKFGNLSIEVTRSGKLKQFLWGETHVQEFQPSKEKLSKEWNHIAYTFGKVNEKTVSSLYLNGKLYNEVFLNFTDSIVLRNVIIGCVHSKNGKYLNQFNAVLDEVVLWKKTLTKEETANLFRSGLPTYESNELTLAATSIAQ